MTFGISFKKQYYEFWLGIFSTNFWHHTVMLLQYWLIFTRQCWKMNYATNVNMTLSSNGPFLKKIYWRWVWSFECTNEEIEYWIAQFNKLREMIKIDRWSFGTRVEYIDLDIYEGPHFMHAEFLILVSIKTGKQISAWPRQTNYLNYVGGELKRYVRANSKK